MHSINIFTLFFRTLTAVMLFHARLELSTEQKAEALTKNSHSINKQIAKCTQSIHIQLSKTFSLFFVFVFF